MCESEKKVSVEMLGATPTDRQSARGSHPGSDARQGHQSRTQPGDEQWQPIEREEWDSKEAPNRETKPGEAISEDADNGPESGRTPPVPACPPSLDVGRRFEEPLAGLTSSWVVARLFAWVSLTDPDCLPDER